MSEEFYTGLEPKNDNLRTNDYGMRLHAGGGSPMADDAGPKRPPFGGTYEQSMVPNPLNSDYTSTAATDRSNKK